MTQEALYVPGEGVFPLLKPLVGFQRKILSLLEVHPYQNNVFLMLRYRDSNAELSQFILSTLAEHGLRGIRADQPEWIITEDVYNPLAALYCCKYGIALFDEAEEGQIFNPNVLYELGVLQSQGKSCLILKHKSLPQLPFDLSKDLHHVYEREEHVRQAVARWVEGIAQGAQSGSPASPRIVTVEEESLALGAGLARLASQGLTDVAPRLGGIDLAAFFAGVEKSADVGFPLYLPGVRLALGEICGFVRDRQGIFNLILMEPEVLSGRDEPSTAVRSSDLLREYYEQSEAMIRKIQSLVGETTRGVVRVYRQSFASGYSLFRRDDQMIVAPWNDGLHPEESPCLVLARREGPPGGMFDSYLGAFVRTIRERTARLIWTNRA